ncbi:MAG: FHA domain-containing protein [Chloroflexi bacterium]|nr:FHA domain-containing protein [Chloroflexota bacterium]
MRGHFISGPAALLVLLFFFLPWVTVSCSGQPLGQFTGYDLAVGAPLFVGTDAVGVPSLPALPGDRFLFVVPGVALLTLLWVGLAFARQPWARLLGLGVVLTAVSGLALLAWRWAILRLTITPLMTVVYEPGLWLTMGGLVGILLGGVVSIVRPRQATAADLDAEPQPTVTLPPLEIALNPTPDLSPEPATAVADFPPVPPGSPASEQTELIAAVPETLAWLVIRDGDQAGSQYRLFAKTLIGRHPTNDVALPDSAMSSVHAVITWENGRFTLNDLQSTNGVYVKEVGDYSWRRVNTAVLNNNMQIKLGRTVFHMLVIAAP